jgi:hypothetical protein
MVGLYRDFFIQTNDKTFILPSIVPDKTRFTELIQQIEAARIEESQGCSVSVNIASESFEDLEDTCVLVEAAYNASKKTTSAAFRLSDVEPSTYWGSNASLCAVDESRITFRRDSAVHARVKSLIDVRGQGDERGRGVVGRA